MTIPPLSWLRPSIAARTRFFDDQVMAAIARGIDQIVVLGAGYDDRALRFTTRGVTFFEIDHSQTQSDKLRRLEAMHAGTEGLVLAAADFRHDDVSRVLAPAGHDARSATLFMCEGLLVYLEQDTVVGLLTSLRALAAPDSMLVASLATHRPDAESDSVIAAANARRRTGATEPWRTILPRGAHLQLLSRAGWQVQSVVDAADLGEGVVEGRSLLVTARPGHPETTESVECLYSPHGEDRGSGRRDSSSGLGCEHERGHT